MSTTGHGEEHETQILDASFAKKTLKRRRGTLRAKFTRIQNRLIQQISKSDEVEISKCILQDLESAYIELEDGNANYLELLDSDDENDGDEVSRINNDMDLIYSELCNMRITVLKMDVKDVKPEVPEQRNTRGVHVKKLDPPTFGGYIREYPTFKQNDETLMKSSFGEDPFALRSCLYGEALDTIRAVDNDYTEMIRRLDHKYGRPEKLIDVVIHDLDEMETVDDDNPQGFIRMVEKVENCWLSLRKMGMQREMDNATITSKVEKLLPNVQKMEWSLRKLKNKHTSFVPLLDFILEERNAFEYMGSQTRDVSHATTCASLTSSVHNQHSKAESMDTMFGKIMDGLTNLSEMITENRQLNVRGQITEGLKGKDVGIMTPILMIFPRVSLFNSSTMTLKWI